MPISNENYYFKLKSNAILNCSDLGKYVFFVKQNQNDHIRISSDNKYSVENNVLKIKNIGNF
jgi:hypothetical protein